MAPARAKAESKLRNNPILDEEPGVPNLTAELQPSAESSTASSSSSASPPSGQANQIRALKCLPVRTGVKPLPKKPNVPDDVYHSGDLEHPAVPGLMLNLEQRLYGIALEYIDTETGETLFETMQEKRFRVFWQKPVAMSPSSTSDSFVKMDRGLFKKQ